jgi:DHA1 family multidrug resistance protein-like MFS transporter
MLPILMNSKNLSFLEAILIIVPMTFVIRASNNMIITTIPLIARYDFLFNNTEIGLISALFSLGTFITSGIINARLKSPIRRKVFISSSISYAIVLPLFYLSSPLLIWLFSALAGFSLGAIMPNIINAAGLLKDRKARERLLSIYTLALSVSLVAGPAIESLILKYYTLRSVFLWFEPFAVLAVILSFFIQFPEEKNIVKTSVNVFSNPGFKVAVINILSYNIPFAVFTAFAGVYAKQVFGISYSQVTALFSLFFLTSFIARLYLSIRPAQLISRFTTFSILTTAVGLSIITLTKSFPLFLLALFILGFPHGITYPMSVISISRTFTPETRNAANSQFFAIMMLVGVVTPTIAGLIAQLIGIRLMFGVLVPVVLFLLGLLRRYVKTVDEVSA